MKVLFEPEAFSIQDFGGVSRYFFELIDNAGPELTCELPVVLSNNLYLRDRRHTRHLGLLPGVPVPGSWRLMQFANRRAARHAIARQDFDVFHPTINDQTWFLELLGDKPFVITIHDMIPALFGQYYQSPDTALQKLVSRAARIITVSENTKADVLRLLPVPAERVTVVHHGHTCRHYPYEARVPTPDSYLLYTGNRRAYKNFGCLVTAFGQLHKHSPGLHLVCAGGGAFTPDEQHELRHAGIAEHTHQLGYLTDGQLNHLYHGARAFVFPSEYEGFGFPILEAFGQHCPAVLSNASCFPEIAHDAAIYFNPHDPNDLHEQLDRVLHDRALRQILTRRGQGRVLDFTWARTVADTHRVYEEAREDATAVAY